LALQGIHVWAVRGTLWERKAAQDTLWVVQGSHSWALQDTPWGLRAVRSLQPVALLL
jgi:hypothetical protein